MKAYIMAFRKVTKKLMYAKRFSFYAKKKKKKKGAPSSFARKNTPLARFNDSMQCFQFNKKHNAFLGTECNK
jgi:hypothetical protein